MSSKDKPKGEITPLLSRPAEAEVLSKAAWFGEHFGLLPKKIKRHDVARFPNLVFEYLKLVLWKYGEVFFLIGKDGEEVVGTIMPPGSIQVIRNDDGGILGYYEGELPEDAYPDQIKLFRPDEIMHLRRGS